MFLENLASSVLLLCDNKELTYEEASERCQLSSRYFSDIVRKKTSPTLKTLEKICLGFDVTPNDLLLFPIISQNTYLSFPLPVTKVLCFRDKTGQQNSYALCPGCGTTLEREYQHYCDRCGQHLSWKHYSSAEVLMQEI